MNPNHYCVDRVNYKRRETIEVKIGDTPLGSMHPIRVQSMTTHDTMDTKNSVEQILRMVDAGCEYVRLTAPSIKEAKNLEEIKKNLRASGCDVPLVADIHFTPNAAEVAARLIEKVRVNPGNYADKKKFAIIEYDDDSYRAELDRIRERFSPLVGICKEYGTAMRIGTNHGSLSDRILSRYGDTPLGMVESALEFIRICEDLKYRNVVISMKASNTRVMIQAYRLLVNRLEAEGLPPYPLHLGVTEAGDGEDGRIKSAVGIGTLLEDGLGDTVRVSLTEEPELEAPVAQNLINRYTNRSATNFESSTTYEKDPFQYYRRATEAVNAFGKEQLPQVITYMPEQLWDSPKALKAAGHHYLPELDKWASNDTAADFIYTGAFRPQFDLPKNVSWIIDAQQWSENMPQTYPLYQLVEALKMEHMPSTLSFVQLNTAQLRHNIETLKSLTAVVYVLSATREHAMADMRDAIALLDEHAIKAPIVLQYDYSNLSAEKVQLYAATDIGGLLVDGMGDAVMLSINHNQTQEALKEANEMSFGILQAARTRMTKTEYISCPSCGRTLFDLQTTTARIREKTHHLKGVKIGVMGCIVNGPGEMADADFGYVGSGKGKITLYKGQEVIKRAVPTEYAVDELIQIIKDEGRWVEPSV